MGRSQKGRGGERRDKMERDIDKSQTFNMRASLISKSRRTMIYKRWTYKHNSVNGVLFFYNFELLFALTKFMYFSFFPPDKLSAAKYFLIIFPAGDLKIYLNIYF